MTGKPPRNLPVTDHAVLRWLESFAHLDTEAVREMIYRDAHQALVSGASKVTINGVEYRLRDGHVITLVDRRPAPKPLKWQSK